MTNLSLFNDEFERLNSGDVHKLVVQKHVGQKKENSMFFFHAKSTPQTRHADRGGPYL